MLRFLKNGIEFNKLADAFGKLYTEIKDLQPILHKNEAELKIYKERNKLEMMVLGYFAKKEIIDRMDKYGWELDALIIVNKISRDKITLKLAWNETLSKLHILIGLLGLQDEYDDILNNGPLTRVIEDYIERDKKINKYFGS